MYILVSRPQPGPFLLSTISPWLLVACRLVRILASGGLVVHLAPVLNYLVVTVSL